MLKVGIYNKGAYAQEYKKEITSNLNEKLSPSRSDLNESIVTSDIITPVSSSTSLEVLIDDAKKLRNNGANALAIPHNGLSKQADAIEQAMGMHVIRPASGIAKEAEEQSIKRIGFVGTQAIMSTPYMKYILQMHGIEVVVPNEEDQALINDIIFQILIPNDLENYAKSKAKVLEIMSKFQNVDGFATGCMELPKILCQDDFSLPLLLSMDLHKKDIEQRIINSISYDEAQNLGVDSIVLKKVKTNHPIYY